MALAPQSMQFTGSRPELRFPKQFPVFLADQRREGQQVLLDVRPQPRHQRLGLGFLFWASG